MPVAAVREQRARGLLRGRLDFVGQTGQEAFLFIRQGL
jgi:hypothetical protein